VVGDEGEEDEGDEEMMELEVTMPRERERGMPARLGWERIKSTSYGSW
jgi:hypothetical protein